MYNSGFAEFRDADSDATCVCAQDSYYIDRIFVRNAIANVHVLRSIYRKNCIDHFPIVYQVRPRVDESTDKTTNNLVFGPMVEKRAAFATWTRVENFAKAYRTTRKGGPDWKFVTHRRTEVKDGNGEWIEIEPKTKVEDFPKLYGAHAALKAEHQGKTIRTTLYHNDVDCTDEVNTQAKDVRKRFKRINLLGESFSEKVEQAEEVPTKSEAIPTDLLNTVGASLAFPSYQKVVEACR